MQNPRRQLSGEIRAVFNTAILVLVFVTMWMPYTIAAVTSVASSKDITVFSILGVFVTLNSAINPILYAMNKDFRKAYKTVLQLFHLL